MLQAVVRQHDVDARVREQRFDASHAIGARPRRGSRCGARAARARRRPPRGSLSGATASRPLGAFAAIAARHDADFAAALLQLLGEPNHERRLAGTADADVADDDHGHRRLDGRRANRADRPCAATARARGRRAETGHSPQRNGLLPYQMRFRSSAADGMRLTRRTASCATRRSSRPPRAARHACRSPRCSPSRMTTMRSARSMVDRPMRDDERRAAAHETRERGLDAPLGFGVERGRGFVEDQHGRILQQRASDRDALALAAREQTRRVRRRAYRALAAEPPQTP